MAVISGQGGLNFTKVVGMVKNGNKPICLDKKGEGGLGLIDAIRYFRGGAIMDQGTPKARRLRRRSIKEKSARAAFLSPFYRN